MKLKKKLLVTAVTLALVSPAVTTMTNQTIPQVVQAAKVKQTGKITLGGTGSVPLTNRKGKTISGRNLKGGSTVRFYGQPRLVNVRYYTDLLFKPAQIKGHDFISLGDGGYVKTSATSGSTNKGLQIIKNAYVYNKKGQRLRTYRGKKALLKKNTVIKYGGKQYKTIPQSFFSVGNGHYVAARHVTQMNGRPLLTLGGNAYLYNRKGKRLAHRKLLKGAAVATNSKVRQAKTHDQYYFYQSTDQKNRTKLTFASRVIKGQPYVSLGRGRYLKLANVQTANGMILFTKGPIRVTLNNHSTNTVYDAHFKETAKILKPGTKVTLDKVMIDTSLSDPQLYFRIKGTDRLVYWGDDGEYPGGYRTANFDPDYDSIYSFTFKQFME